MNCRMSAFSISMCVNMSPCGVAGVAARDDGAVASDSIAAGTVAPAKRIMAARGGESITCEVSGGRLGSVMSRGTFPAVRLDIGDDPYR